MKQHYLYYIYLDLRSRIPSSKDLMILLTILAVVSFKGLKRLRMPENLGYEHATITAIDVQKRVGRSGYELSAKLADGTEVTAPRAHLRPTDKIGAKICLRRMRNKGRAGIWYQGAFAHKCAPTMQQFLLVDW